MEKYYIAVLGGVSGFGYVSIARLINFFGNAKTAWNADANDLILAGIKPKQRDRFIAFRHESPDAPERLIDLCERQKINLCSIVDDDYPPILKEIDSPPMFFYYRGKLEPLAERIGIVGTRQNTTYGQSVALELGEELAAAGLTVVSGAARGIDTFAHYGALKSGRTIAVLGCGINHIFPPENKKLLEEITERGVVMSEFSPQLMPNHGTFPQRNRIIAGLCRGVIVVEAGIKSGSVMTGNLALKNNRDVFAFPQSNGCNELIRNGAFLIHSPRDVLEKCEKFLGREPLNSGGFSVLEE